MAITLRLLAAAVKRVVRGGRASPPVQPDRLVNDSLNDCLERQDNHTQLGGTGEDAGPQLSYSHRHHDVAVLVLFAFGGAHLSGGLGIFEFEFHVAAAGCFEEIEKVLRVEADGDGVALVVDFERVFGLAGFS